MNEYLDLAWDLFGAAGGLVRRRADGWARVDGSSGDDKMAEMIRPLTRLARLK